MCTLVYTQTYYSTPFLSPSSPSSDDVHPLRAALHAGRRLSAHVLCGGQRQIPPPPAAHGGGVRVHCDKQRAPGHSLCTCGMCCVCFAHPVTHMCAHASLASTSGLLDHLSKSGLLDHLSKFGLLDHLSMSGLLDHFSADLAC